MKKVILYSLLLFSALSVLAENFDPAACLDLTVRTYMPGEGLVKAISSHWKLNFGKVKIGFDVSMVTIAACASYCFLRNDTRHP